MKRICSVTVIAALLFQIAYVPCVAQKVVPGQRVRIRVPTKQELKGKVITIRADTLTMQLMKPGPSSTLAIPFSSITELEISKGQQGNTLKGAGFGLLGGGLMGLKARRGCGDNSQCDLVNWLIILGAGAGVVIGGFFGSTIRVEKWEKVPLDHLRLGIMPQHQGGILLSALLEF
jgi:hypothetical protein